MSSPLFFCKIIFGITLFVFVSLSCFGQKSRSNYIGVSIAGEIESGKLNPKMGVFAFREFTPKSSMEFGVFFRTVKSSFLVNIPLPEGGFYSDQFNVTEGYLNFPIFYRFTTRFVNFSLGPTVDIFSSWNQNKVDRGVITGYSISPRVRVGPQFKIGKNIPLKGSLSLEPEFRVRLRSLYGETVIGFGVRIHQQMNLKE